MSKHIKRFLIMSFLVGGFLSFPNIQAAAASYGLWENVPGYSSCKVRMVTDYSTYSTSATTIDAYIENNGHSTCPRIDYNTFIVDDTYGQLSAETYSGYFSSRTPTKYFYLSKFVDVNANPNSAQVQAQLRVNGKSFTVNKPITYYH